MRLLVNVRRAKPSAANITREQPADFRVVPLAPKPGVLPGRGLISLGKNPGRFSQRELDGNGRELNIVKRY
jgi:hypothetical protein